MLNGFHDFVVLPVNRFAAKPAAAPPLNPQETLLREIRDAPSSGGSSARPVSPNTTPTPAAVLPLQ